MLGQSISPSIAAPFKPSVMVGSNFFAVFTAPNTSMNMNMTVTIFGFVLSALFVLMICCRLLCFRLRGRQDNILESASRDTSNFVDRASHGLEPSIVASFPTIKYNQHIFVSKEDNICTICLDDYEDKELLRVLPNCGHAFHVVCIDVWLRQHPTCPVCRVSLQFFPNWRRRSGPLLNVTAKSRFVAGAIPDTMFENPKGFHDLPMSGLQEEKNTQHTDNIRPDVEHINPTLSSTAFRSSRGLSAHYLHSGWPMVAGYRAAIEMAESSTLSRLQTSV
ncbi:hypothetical protein GOP47_0025877 [Adiantum capillus-veneris]|uniref:RING-type E3 ubiquitin transferase n=1 Tax=Adiantum capillus-veneris TaxID=13818 RepID=A0A9D4Z2I3_ADICA|nr:hypothetical protein GOP47_0025877 [Adiantum capillus-veneris]